MNETIERTESRKAIAQSRLERASAIEVVLPTARRVARNDPRLLQLAQDIRSESNEAVEAYASELARVAPPDHEVPVELLANPAFSSQVAAFAQAGIAFFRPDPAYLELGLSDRRAAGGSGSVTRTLHIGDRLLLETPRIVIRFADGADEDDRKALFKEYRLVEIEPLAFAANTRKAAVLGGRPALDVCLELLQHPAIDYAEPDFVEYIGKRSTNDPDLGRQWHLDNRHNPGMDIAAFAAWRRSTGEGVRVAVIDNGFDITHGDLAFGTLSGWYRATADTLDANFVRGLSGMPSRNHGTACAGMVCARANNGYGGAGVAHAAELMAIACLSDQIGPQSTLARAIGYAVDPATELDSGAETSGADVIVCSLGPNDAEWQMSLILREAIEFAASDGRDGKGTPLFWASTNGNFPISADEVCSHPTVITVGRSNEFDQDDGSGFGPELAFLAPGVGVYLPAKDNHFAITTGTSFAAPCAAGVAALVLACDPSLTAKALRTLLEDTCDKIGTLPYDPADRNDRFGHGRVNADRALAAANCPAAPDSKISG